jgi:hypothetical protein
MFETRPNLHRSWDNYNWDWALILLFALVVLVGTILWTYPDHPQTAVIPDDATTGRSIQPSLPTFLIAIMVNPTDPQTEASAKEIQSIPRAPDGCQCRVIPV